MNHWSLGYFIIGHSDIAGLLVNQVLLSAMNHEMMP